MLRRCCKNGPGVPLVWPCFFLSGELASNDLLFENDREAACSTRCAYFGDDVVDCPGVSLVWSCVLPSVERLAPKDLWNSKNIEKAAAMSPNVVDYLLVIKNSN
jgi:hypothetical protein